LQEIAINFLVNIYGFTERLVGNICKFYNFVEKKTLRTTTDQKYSMKKLTAN